MRQKTFDSHLGNVLANPKLSGGQDLGLPRGNNGQPSVADPLGGCDLARGRKTS